MSKKLKENLKTINEHFGFLKKTYHVKKMGVFGSVATGKQTKESDIDILIEFSQPVGFFKFIELENFLSKILKNKVDLVSKKALKPIIKKNVLKEVVYV